MSDAVIVGLLSLAGTFLGTYSGLRLMAYRIEQLEKRVEKHNQFAERLPVLEEQQKVTNHRLTDLENKVG